MSGLAKILLEKNVEVSGSDRGQSELIRFLEEKGAAITLGHSAANIAPSMTVVFSSAITEDNPEFQAALKFQCTRLHRSDLLLQLTEGCKTLAISGTHGKTMTSALLAWVCVQANLDPSFAIGGILLQLRSNAKHGKGDHFIAEADESDGSFLKYHPFGAIVTNIGLDHMNFYQTEDLLLESFNTFMANVEDNNLLFWCGDDQRLKKLARPGISYGFEEHCDLQCSGFKQIGWTSTFAITFEGKHYPDIEIPLIGRHQVLNASAVFGLALRLGIDENTIRKAFKTFGGVARRCERKGEQQGILFIDDYAHHPTEIQATLTAIRNAVKDRRLIVLFQPHRFTRIRDCLGNFGGVFDSADELLITEIYSAGECSIEGVGSQVIVQEIKQTSRLSTRIVSRKDVVRELTDVVRPHDVVVTLGAGDAAAVGPDVIAALKKKNPKLNIGLIYGGRSVEHHISLLSAEFVKQSFRQEYYDICPVFLPKENNTALKEVFEKLQACDVLFPVLHGPFGEDGTIQGLFEMLGKAYIGMDFRSAAICMDKRLTKTLMTSHGIRTSPFMGFAEHEWRADPRAIQETIHNQLTFPLFVKAPHLGSSIGVYKVEKEEDLSHAIEDAFQYDTHVMVENEIVGRELEFAVLGNADVTVFPPGEICTGGNVYDYEAKYGAHSFATTLQAKLEKEQLAEGQAFVKRVYRTLGCSGMARIDTFLDEQGRFWLNEVNPIPGFTSISLFPQICEVHGIPPDALMDRLVILAMEEDRRKKRKVIAFG